MKFVYICSPFRGDVETNTRIAVKMMKLALERGYYPIAPHLMYPQALPDDDPKNRQIGLRAGLAWVAKCDKIWVYGDRTPSEGMLGEMLEAQRHGIEQRTITAYEVEEQERNVVIEVTTKLWEWFGLSYASWLTLPRVLLHNMPSSWQDKLAVLLDEYYEKYPNMHKLEIGTRVQITQKGRLVKTPQWLINYRRPDMDAIGELMADTTGKETHEIR